MRAILVTAIIFGLLPFALFRPFVGVALWTWVSVMNPHRLAWSFAHDFPFALVIALVTFVSLLIAWKDWKFPITSLTLALLAFFFWITVTQFFALHQEESLTAWSRVAKTLLMTLVALAVVRSEREILAFAWILVLSVGFFGVKGGIFVILTGGQDRVYGPPESYIADNNAISIALVMITPLLIFLLRRVTNRMVRVGGMVSVILSGVAVVGSYSRGAVVAASAMLFFLVLKARKRLLLIILILSGGAVVLFNMPEKWAERVESISAYGTDRSVLGRFNAWRMAWNLALDRPIVGGGMSVDQPDVFARYAPVPEDVHSAHSIYFQMLGEHGFVGLGLYLLLGSLMWMTGRRVIRLSRLDPTIDWHGDFARALQISLVGFAVGGLTVNIGYWDVIYYEVALMVALERLTTQAIAERAAGHTTVDAEQATEARSPKSGPRCPAREGEQGLTRVGRSSAC